MFIDESGDHGLSNIDSSFHVFVLCGILISETDYNSLNESFNIIRKPFWKDRKVIFHSRDIRKCDKEFKIMPDNNIKQKFYKALDLTVSESPYSVIASIIDKEEYIKNTGN